MKYVKLIFRNLRRNVLRSLLTTLVTMVLVFVVTIVWSVLWLLDLVTAEKTQNFQAMVADRWSVPSRLPFSYAEPIGRGAARNPDDVRPVDSMTWQFFIGTLDSDLSKISRENIVFAIACEPEKIGTMMEGFDSLSGAERAQLNADVERLKVTRQGIILGYNHLVRLKARHETDEEAKKRLIGDRLTLYGMSISKGLEMEFEVVGVFPPGRYDTMAAFDRKYLVNALDEYPSKHNGQEHPWAERNLTLVVLKVTDSKAFERVASQIENSPELTNPVLRCETMASGISSMLEPFRDLIWGVRWLLAPACLVTILLVIANAIGITVRERRLEMAVLKVLGFRPRQILILVLGESLLLGIVAGFASSGLTFAAINWGLGGISFPIGFFARFMIPYSALWWGPAVGGVAALFGSLFPAWSACNVKVAEVFSKVA
jgi:putative ABC transport system permease protein